MAWRRPRAVVLAAGSFWWGARSEEGFTDGIDGNRYSLFQEDPKPEDQLKAKGAADDIKCTVCEVILRHLLEDVGMLTDEDHVLNVLEGEPSEAEIQKAREEQDKNLLNLAKGRRGCARHFKDSFLRKGWDVEGCKIANPNADPKEKTPPWQTVYGTCTKSGQPVQNETKMDTYSVRMEAMYWACELTIGTHRDAIAKMLSKRLKTTDGDARPALLKEVCERRGKCTTNKYIGTYEERVKEADDRWKEQQMGALESTKKSEKEKAKKKKQDERKQRHAERKKQKEEKLKAAKGEL